MSTSRLVTSESVNDSLPAGAGEMMIRRKASVTPEQLRRRRRRNRLLEVGLGIGAPVLLLVVWQLCSDNNVVNPQFFPPPTDVWDAGVRLARDGSLEHNLLVSLRRVLIGSVLGVGVGVLAGVALGTSRWCRVALEPLLSALYTVPKLAIFPLLLLIFGLNDSAINISIAITVFFFMWISTMSKLRVVQ